jgi:hypothetical protein
LTGAGAGSGFWVMGPVKRKLEEMDIHTRGKFCRWRFGRYPTAAEVEYGLAYLERETDCLDAAVRKQGHGYRRLAGLFVRPDDLITASLGHVRGEGRARNIRQGERLNSGPLRASFAKASPWEAKTHTEEHIRGIYGFERCDHPERVEYLRAAS